MKLKRPTIAVAAIVATTVLAVVPSGAQAETASLPASQICEPMSTAYDVNDVGTVAGYVGSWPDYRAAVCSAEGVLSYLATPVDATSSIAVAINSVGQTAGQITLASGASEAAVWDSSGTITRLGFLSNGSLSSAQDINDNGWVVGVASAAGVYQGFVWNGSGPIAGLPMPVGMTSAFAEAINNDGVVAGEASAMFVPSAAVVWKDGSVAILPPLVAATPAAAADINDAGQVVGNSSTGPPEYARHAVLWDGGNVVDLGSLGGSFGLASAVNADGQIAGYMTDPATNLNHAFVWENGNLTLLDPLSGDALSVGLGMNDTGEIVGISSQSDTALGRAVSWTLAGDTTRPALSVSVSPSMLWPPNHKYVTVHATVSATDNSGADPTVELLSITSNEPDNGSNDGSTVNDIVTTADPYTFQLRAERDENGTGRIYTITYRATDKSGNSATQAATVTVPVTW